MKEVQAFEFHIDEFEDYDWIFAPESGENDIFSVRENVKKAAEIYGVNPEFLEAVDSTFRELADELIGAFRKDLIDLYQKIP